MENVVEIGTKKAGITIDFKILNSAAFNEAIQMLSARNDFSDFQAAYNVAKIKKGIDAELKTAREMFAKWTEEFFEKDENGQNKFAAQPGPVTPFEIKEGMKDQFDAQMEKFLATEVKIGASAIRRSDLGRIVLSPNQVVALEPILDLSSFEPVPQGH
jgi:hypothetical protein